VKHVHANPKEPLVCPILALAIHVIGSVTHENDVVFNAEDPAVNYSKWLTKTLKNLVPEILDEIGIDQPTQKNR
jgi:hypothetical protein